MYGRSSISCIMSVVCRIMTADWCPQFVVCSPGWYLLTAVCCLLCTVLCLYPYYISLIYIYLLPTVLILCKAWKVYNRLRENLTKREPSKLSVILKVVSPYRSIAWFFTHSALPFRCRNSQPVFVHEGYGWRAAYPWLCAAGPLAGLQRVQSRKFLQRQGR